MTNYRFIFITVAAATMIMLSSCNTASVAKREIYTALCVPSNAEGLDKLIATDDLVTNSDVAKVFGDNNLTWIVYSLLVEDPLLSGKYEWSLSDDNPPEDLAFKLATYMNENGSLISEQDTEISIFSRDKTSGIIHGVLHISTSYGLRARVYYEVELNGKGVFIHEARVPLAGSSDSRSGLVIISNNLATDRVQIFEDEK